MGIFIRIDRKEKEITGNVLRGGKRWTEIASFSFGPGERKINRAGDVHTVVTTAVITLLVTPNTSPLLRAARAGSILGTVIIDFTTNGGQAERIWETLTLSLCFVSTVQFSRKSDGSLSESITLDFARKQFTIPDVAGVVDHPIQSGP